jgi:hypothetical protein
LKSRNRSLAPLGLVVLGGLLIVGALAVLAILPGREPPAPTPTSPVSASIPEDGIPRVSVGDAKAALDLNQAVFVDTRGKVFYDEKHIPGALSIPLEELPTRLNELDPKDWIILYCT